MATIRRRFRYHFQLLAILRLCRNLLFVIAELPAGDFVDARPAGTWRAEDVPGFIGNFALRGPARCLSRMTGRHADFRIATDTTWQRCFFDDSGTLGEHLIGVRS